MEGKHDAPGEISSLPEKQARRNSSTTERSMTLSNTSKKDVDEEVAQFELNEKLLDEQESSDKDSPEEDVKAVGVLQLFRFATPLDRVLTLAGIFFSCAAGVVNPVMIIIFSKLMGVIIQYTNRSA
ncbi:tRNA N6-adenosine threonylcarbamoyltransferase, partial [Coemansia sp. RSA 485]